MADSQVKTANICNITSSTLLRPNAGGSGTYISDNTISVHMTNQHRASGIYVSSLPEQSVIGDKYTISFVPVCATNNVMLVVLYGTATQISFTSGNRYTLTITATAADNIMAFYGGDTVEKTIIIKDIQIEKGETATVYRPYSTTGWVHSLRKLTTATEAVENPLYSDGTAITAYTLKGNTVQSGTPTPSNPVDVNGVGVRTENLFDGNLEQGGLNGGDGSELDSDYRVRSSYIKLDGGTYTISCTSSNIIGIFIYNGSTYERYTGYYASPLTFTLSEPRYVRIGFSTAPGNIPISPSSINNAMLNVGSTAKPYEPYGYKIPISSGGVTTNIYLGSTQMVRQVNKYTFTGNETIFSCVATTDGQNYCVAYRFMDFGMTDIKDFDKIMEDIDYPIFISTHFKEKTNTNSKFNNIQPNQVGANTVITASNRYIIFCIAGLTTAADYSAWFAQQYANGTPVEVYYILETATTSIVNEPLMKIDTYADTLSNATSIPTTEGANSITVDTTVQPSEFTATWTGWHNASVKEKSENLFDTFDIVGQVPSISNGQLITYNGSTTSLIPIISGNITVTKPPTALLYLLLYAADMSYIGCVQNSTDANFYGSSVTGYENAKYCRLRIDRTTGLDDIQIMLNTGSTALPYEPYWK